jgi:asparaginyl-tRNA synthetase
MMLMETTIIKDLYRNTKSFENQEIKIEGWVRTVRDSKTFGFIELNDGSCLKNLQVVFEDNLPNFAEICKL